MSTGSAARQSADSGVSINPLFQPLLFRLRHTVRIPVLLPPDIPGQTGPLLADLGAGSTQYTITVHQSRPGERLGFDNQVADISGLRLTSYSFPLTGQRVQIVSGIVGHYYKASSTNPYVAMEWRQAGNEYRIGLNHGTLGQLKTLAGWAIQHPINLDDKAKHW